MAVPFDQRSDLIWFDGDLIPTVDCKISVLTHGLHYASCVFEGERVYGGKVFKLDSKGVPYVRGKGRGNLLVTIHVQTPEKLSRQQKEALKAFSAWQGEEPEG